MIRSLALLDQLTHGVRAYLVLAAFVLVAALPGVFAMPTLDRDEARFAQATSQMLETGDFVVIRYHDELRNKKPVGIHWMQSVSVALFSSAEAREIWAYRLPSTLGAILAVCATFWGGTALTGRRTAFVSAVLLGSTLLLTSEAHIAKTDAMQCGVITLAMAALAHLRNGAGVRTGYVFWLALGLGVLIKFVIAPMVAGLALLALLAWERRLDWAKPLVSWIGITIFCVLVIPWLLAIQVATEGVFLKEAAGVDLGQKLVKGAEGHAAPFGAHLMALPLLFWPATLFLVPGLVAAFRAVFPWRTGKALDAPKEPHPDLAAEAIPASAFRFLLCWAIPAWLVFEAAPTKLLHYTLPVYPALALMAGIACDRWIAGVQFTVSKWASLALFLLVALALAAIASPVVLDNLRAEAAGDFPRQIARRVADGWAADWQAHGTGVWLTLLILAGVGGLLWTLVRDMRVQALAALAALALLVGVPTRTLLLPGQTWMLPTGAAMSALNDLCGLPEGVAEPCAAARPPAKLRVIAFAEPSLVFEMAGKVVLPPTSTSVIPPPAEEPRPAWLINATEPIGARAINRIIAQADKQDRCVRLSRRNVRNYSNGDAARLVAVVVEPGACENLRAPASPAVPPPAELREAGEG